MTVPDYIRCSHQGTLLKLGWPNSLHWPLRALGPQKSYANEKKYWELLQRPHKYIKDRSSKQKHFHRTKQQGPGIYYSSNSKWCFFSSTPTLHSVILSFPQYGKITTSPTGFYWPFQQLKNITLSNTSHISFLGTNNRKIGKWMWAKWRKFKSSLMFFHINNSHSTSCFFWLHLSY